MLNTYLTELCGKLRAAGLETFLEYEKQEIPKKPFVTLAAEKMLLEPAFPGSEDTVVPVQLELRIRLHCPPDCRLEQLDQMREIVLMTLLPEDYAVIGGETEAAAYQKAIDRFSETLRLQICGIMRLIPEEEEGNSDADDT